MLITRLITLFLTFFGGEKMLITIFGDNYVKSHQSSKNCTKCTKIRGKYVEKSRLDLLIKKCMLGNRNSFKKNSEKVSFFLVKYSTHMV